MLRPGYPPEIQLRRLLSTARKSFSAPPLICHRGRGAVSEERSVPDSTVLTPDIHKPVPSLVCSALWARCRYSHISPLFWQIPRRKEKKDFPDRSYKLLLPAGSLFPAVFHRKWFFQAYPKASSCRERTHR